MGDKPRLLQLDIWGGEGSPVRSGRVPRPRIKKRPRPDGSPRTRAAAGEASCGDCRWLRMKTFPGCDAVHPKCAFTANGGWSTTIAYRDAACGRFEAAARPGPAAEPTAAQESES